jgi:hypothetical protein
LAVSCDATARLRAWKAELERIVLAQGEVIGGFHAQDNGPGTRRRAARAEVVGQKASK